MQRPRANEGGRREEEKGSEIAISEAERLHDRKNRPSRPGLA
jgi:hypothetical protein